MLADHVITRDELFAVGATFTLVAWAFAYVFVVWQAIEPGSFTAAVNPEAQRTWMELLFLSFTTLSSTGLSDVIPIDPFARSLVMIEQLVGVAYIAVVVSRLVALTIPRAAMKATIDGGFWAGRRRFNREVLIPDGERQIREAGTFDEPARRRHRSRGRTGASSTRTPTCTSGWRRSGGSCATRRRRSCSGWRTRSPRC